MKRRFEYVRYFFSLFKRNKKMNIICDTCSNSYNSDEEDSCPKCGDDNEEQLEEDNS